MKKIYIGLFILLSSSLIAQEKKSIIYTFEPIGGDFPWALEFHGL